MTIPKSVPILVGEAARKFAEQDKEPLTEKEVAFLRECLEIFRKSMIVSVKQSKEEER